MNYDRVEEIVTKYLLDKIGIDDVYSHYSFGVAVGFFNWYQDTIRIYGKEKADESFRDMFLGDTIMAKYFRIILKEYEEAICED